MADNNQRIMRILRRDFGISKTDIDTNTNLISQYNLCGWELELLYVKLEQAFKIQIDLPIPHDELSIVKLINDVLVVSTGCSRKRQAF